eukprot:1372490-Rhodomonas_salina.1
MVVLLIPGTEEDNDSQRPAYHYTLAVYEGKDDTENIKVNFGYLAEQMVSVMSEGLTFGNLHLDVDIFMPCDMKAHWAIFACGGIHDKDEQFCHCCCEKQPDRQLIYQWHTLPGPGHG